MDRAPTPTAAPSDDAAAIAALERGLNAAQLEAVVSPADPLRILAGAGSGKTRVLTHRIAHRALSATLDPERVLAVTFTRKAAGELRERLGRLGLRHGVHAGTFHSIAYAQLRQRWEERGVRPPELLERKVGFVARLMNAKRGSTTALDVVGELEWAAARMVTPETYEAEAAAARRDPPIALGEVAAVYERFLAEKRRQRLVDFDDLLRLAARDLAADPVYAAGRHWRFRHLFVDEFQDVNPQQYVLLRAWLGPESDLCVVGDPNQAIYAWNGADARYLTDFDHYFPGGETVTLEDNYRSTPQILAVANAVLSSGPSVAIRLAPNRPAGAVPTVREHPDQTAEAEAIAQQLRDRHPPGSRWGDQAVLVRTNAQATVIAEVLTRRSIPHRIRGGGDLLRQPEVTQAIATIRRAPDLQVALSDLEDDLRRATDATAAGPRLTEERAANVRELVRLGREYQALEPTGGVGAFVAWLSSTLRGEDSDGGDAVDLATFHAAKGLEWSIVHLAGLEEGYVPIHHARDDEAALDEERRLLYVALTRARDELHCTWAATRAFGSRSAKRSPSPWLDIVAETVGHAPRRTPRREGAARARAARASLRAGRGADDELAAEHRELFEALRSWRRDVAKQADVPAFVVFNDATLREVAERRPTTREQLRSVSGIGPAKDQRFGDDVLRIVAEH